MKRNQKVMHNLVQKEKEKFTRDVIPQIKPVNNKQRLLFDALENNTIVVAQGSAGVGKTLVACYHAAKRLANKQVKKVVLIRAYQPLAGRSIGMLPGTLKEKLQPFYQQMIDYFEDFLGKATTDIYLKNDVIEICSLETIRGRSWNDAIILVDEAQSLFVPEVQALTTRIGERSQMVFCGDNSGLQTDVKVGMDGLTYLSKLTQKYKIEGVEVVNFDRNDICRSDIVRDFVIAFEDELFAESEGKDVIVKQQDVNKQFKHK